MIKNRLNLTLIVLLVFFASLLLFLLPSAAGATVCQVSAAHGTGPSKPTDSCYTPPLPSGQCAVHAGATVDYGITPYYGYAGMHVCLIDRNDQFVTCDAATAGPVADFDEAYGQFIMNIYANDTDNADRGFLWVETALGQIQGVVGLNTSPCYSYGQGYYYGYGQGYYYGYGQANYYGYSQSYYYDYSQSYYYGYSQGYYYSQSYYYGYGEGTYYSEGSYYNYSQGYYYGQSYYYGQGSYVPQNRSISGFVFIDNNGNGVFDNPQAGGGDSIFTPEKAFAAGEDEGYPGSTVWMMDSDQHDVYDWQDSGSNGWYDVWAQVGSSVMAWHPVPEGYTATTDSQFVVENLTQNETWNFGIMPEPSYSEGSYYNYSQAYYYSQSAYGGGSTECNDGVDNDGDGWGDLEDPGCEDGDDDDETNQPTSSQCSDGQDNDNDTLADGNDPGCASPQDNSEENVGFQEF